MNTLAPAWAWLGPFLIALQLLLVGFMIWMFLPRRNERRDADIDRQIATLRKSADHAVTRRPRVRAGGYQPIATPGAVKAPPRNPSAKPCGGGMCRKRIDCADNYCPGKYEARIAAINPSAEPGVRLLKH